MQSTVSVFSWLLSFIFRSSGYCGIAKT